MMTSVVALALCGGGIGCLFGAWRPKESRPRLIAVGWLLLFISTAFWIAASGAEFGISYALMALSLFAWLAVLVNFEVRQIKQQKDKPAGDILIPGARTISRHLLLFVATVPVSGAAAVLGSVALTFLLPWQLVNSGVLAILLMPLLWGLAAWWASADTNILRPLLGLGACAGLGALIIFL